MLRDALEGNRPQRRLQKRFDRRLEEATKAVGGGYCRLQTPLRLALGVRGTVAGHRLTALEGGGVPPPSSASLPMPLFLLMWSAPTRMHARTYTHTHPHTLSHPHIHACTCTYATTCTCTHMHTQAPDGRADRLSGRDAGPLLVVPMVTTGALDPCGPPSVILHSVHDANRPLPSF